MSLVKALSSPMSKNPKYPTNPQAIVKTPYRAVPKLRIRIGITATAAIKGVA